MTRMLSKNDIKNIKSLELKKFRDEKRLFVAEGHKLVGELLGVFKCVLLVATDEWLGSRGRIPADRIEAVTPDELKRASLLRSPQDVLAVFCMPDDRQTMKEAASKNLVLAMDDVQDPGNLGTIMRIADWFGIQHIVCSQDTADAYAPKAIQATMGSIAHVDIQYTDLPQWLDSLPDDFPAFATTLDGDNLYEAQLPANAVIVMGNEGNGVSQEVQQRLSKKLYIPSYNNQEKGAESLNVAMATAIICAEWRRRG